MTEPLIILAPMRSYSTIAAAMLGQHPEMYSLLETHLFTCDTMQRWWATFGNTIFAHGLLRAVAELMMGHQSEATIELARLWILRRLGWSSAEVFGALARQVDPSVLIDKSPLIVDRIEHLQRAFSAFPKAKFLHLTRHPLGFGRSVLKFFDDMRWPIAIDPQILWCRQHSTILRFLAVVPTRQKMHIRGEDLLAAPDRHLVEVVKWMGLRTDSKAIDRMKHPEFSPFANFGPRNAFLGGDPNFFLDPRLKSFKVRASNLQASLAWRGDGVGFTTSVRHLGQQFGYR